MYIYSSWFFIWMVFEECSLTRLESSVRLIINNIRKASTEKSSLRGIIQREWHLVEAAYEEGIRKPFQSCSA